jgi:hypothetical protein
MNSNAYERYRAALIVSAKQSKGTGTSEKERDRLHDSEAPASSEVGGEPRQNSDCAQSSGVEMPLGHGNPSGQCS